MAYSNDTSIDGLSTFTPSNDDLVVGMDNADSGIAKTTTFSAIKTLFGLSGTNTGDETTTTQGTLINNATAKTTPVDADYVGLMDSAASNILKKLSWANIKATLKTYFDTLYANIAGSTSQAFSVSQLEVGNASDTTLSRSAAGVIAVEGVVIPNTLYPTSNSDGATITFNLSANNKHQVTLGGNRTLALSNTTNIPSFVILLKQDGTGSRTVTWFSGITWVGGVPTLTTTASKTDTFGFIQTSAGVYLGYTIGLNA